MSTVVHPGDALSVRERATYVIVLGALTALGPFTIDMYLPAFPQIAADLNAQEAQIQLTLSATIIGFALGQLLVGPWSDKVGRRTPLIVATSVHVVASLGIALSPDLTWVMIFRVLQGAGAAGGGVVAMATVRDLFGGYPLVRMLSRLALVVGLAPVLAPVIGSQLLVVTDWRGLFVVLAGYALAMIIAAFFLIVETLPAERRHGAEGATTLDRYKHILGDRVFVGVAIVAGMVFSGLFAYLSSSSFLFQEIYGLDAQQYGMLFAINSVGVLIGTQTSARLQKFIGPQWILAATTATQLVASLAIVALDQAGAPLGAILVPLFFFIMSCGFSFPATQVLALVNHGREAGTAASLLGAMNFGLAGLVSPIVGFFGITSAVPMGGVMAVAAAVAIAALWFIVQPKTVPPLAK
ncbi:multidrug effflux MFS transporter [Desertivibrio insolitus]|uniref:multidrug effflux MFS transporter n=1 Tax=Herbiconiux sp. SYSU D00978 TaxID=2812562 RepID=UPI001A9682DF|nr:multidrug effflux MFS transporter [Herbiconiux sp. SYSU D00978]